MVKGYIKYRVQALYIHMTSINNLDVKKKLKIDNINYQI
tara:strand:+ start:2623 stop:2739 length:117 start_codon:yes stop_codon:yes gene_type:complete